MATYATAEQLAAYVGNDPDAPLPADPDALEQLLERAERRLDGLLGPYTHAPGDLKVDPSKVTAAQRSALSRACCAVVHHELVAGLTFLSGGEDFIGGGVAPLYPPTRTPSRALEELSGTGLLKRSGCARPDPNIDEYAPAQVGAGEA